MSRMPNFARRWPTLVSRIAPLALLALSTTAESGTIEYRIAGAVYDSTGKGILGVKVSMVRSGLSTRSAPDGNWSLVARIDSAQAWFPDTVVFGEDDGRNQRNPVALIGPKRSGIVAILPRQTRKPRPIASINPRSETNSRSISGLSTDRNRNDSIPADPGMVSSPVQQAQDRSHPAPPEASPKPKHVASRDSGAVALNWSHPVPSGAFVAEFAYQRESWTGSYGDFPVLFDDPASDGYALSLRYGLWELGNDARTEIGLHTAILQRNNDANDNDGLAQPTLRLRIGLLSSLGLGLLLAPPLGSDRIVGSSTKWTYGGGLWISPRTERIHVNFAVEYRESSMGDGIKKTPKEIAAHFEPQFAPTKWLGGYLATDFALGVNKPLSEDGGRMHDYMLVWLEPGTRLNLGKHLGLGVGVPFTLCGENQVARWAVKATLRGALGL